MSKNFSYCAFSKHSIERVPQKDLHKHIERCGRVCYKSEDKITADSAKKFIENLCKREHYSVLEHGTVYLYLHSEDCGYKEIVDKYRNNHWSRVVTKMWTEEVSYITTNMRVIVENGWESDLVFQCEPKPYHEKRITFKFVHDIGIARDSNRHRVHSISEESTRFINYLRRGATFTASPFEVEDCEEWDTQRIPMVFDNMWMGEHEGDIDALDVWMFSCYTSTYCYNKLLSLGWTPQTARRSLNLGVKTETYYTAYVGEWKEYIRKRVKAHPDLIRLVREMIELLHEELTEEEYNGFVERYDAELCKTV